MLENLSGFTGRILPLDLLLITGEVRSELLTYSAVLTADRTMPNSVLYRTRQKAARR